MSEKEQEEVWTYFNPTPNYITHIHFLYSEYLIYIHIHSFLKQLYQYNEKEPCYDYLSAYFGELFL